MASDTELRLKALTRLVVRRQATVTRETLAVYLADLEAIPVRVVEDVCDEIGRAERGEFEDKWPEVAIVLAKCHARMRVERERAESRRLLAPPPGQPVDAEKWKRFREAVEARVAAMRMP